MSRSLLVRNLVPGRAVALRPFKHILEHLLRDLLHKEFRELAFYLVDTPEITRINEAFLRHKGSTDVITFDYSGPGGKVLEGEIFICLAEALVQSRKFRVTWQEELVRYAVHGTLHLCGHDDQHAAARAKMKRMENRLLAQLAARFKLQDLIRGTGPRR
ncbi:MAG TPA: rRNA maturation RNase YbeY [Verrucomicrobiae bacterium]|nr:rRNA maturation RNase YbeY [Verrucomicrobiae bacterium]